MITDQLMGEDGRAFRTVLPNGVRVLTEEMAGLSSATVAVWVDSGSRDESEDAAGSTHFLEHMLFKGTARRTALEIASQFDRTGGESNAVTAKEYTCYFSRCLVDDVPAITELLWDMILHSSLDPEEFERERQVILEELAMSADDPTDVLYDAYDELVYSGHPLGRPVGATRAQIAGLDHSVLREHYAGDYTGPRLVFAAAGGVPHEQLVDLVARATAELPAGPSAPAARAHRDAPAFRGGMRSIVKDTEQQGFLLGVPGLSDGHPDRFVLTVLYALLGGGMSSRLFQEIRERRGLAYSVHTVTSRFRDTGQFGIYAGSSPDAAQTVLDLAWAEFTRIAHEPPSSDEVAEVVAQVAGATILGMESSAARMNRLAISELNRRPLESPAVLLEQVRSVTPAQVSELAARLYTGPRALVTVGPRSSLRMPE